MKRITIIIIVFLCSHILSVAQYSDYCVITFSEIRRPSMEGLEEYLWIVPLDSLSINDSDVIPIYPFVIDYANYYSEYGGISNYRLDMIYTPSPKKQDQLYWLIRKHRHLIQSYNISYKGLARAKIKVYITLIRGNITKLMSLLDNRYFYYSSDFILSDVFLSKTLLDRIKCQRFSLVPYDLNNRNTPKFDEGNINKDVFSCEENNQYDE